MAPCQRCGGSGTYHWGGSINGTPRFSGPCFRCQGGGQYPARRISGGAPKASEFWYCVACNAQNHKSDGECQYCTCPGVGCKRDMCRGSHEAPAPWMSEGEIVAEINAEREPAPALPDPPAPWQIPTAPLKPQAASRRASRPTPLAPALQARLQAATASQEAK